MLAAGVAGADLRTAVTLEARLTGLSNPGDEPLLGGGGSAKLDLVATGNRDVRGQLTLVANLSAAGADQGTGAHVHPSPAADGCDQHSHAGSGDNRCNGHTHPVAGDGLSGAHTHPLGATAGVQVERAFVRARLPGFRLTAGKTRLAWGRGRFFNAGDILFGQAPAFAAGASEFLTASDWLIAAYVPLGRLSFLELVALPPLTPAAMGLTDAGGRAVLRAGELTVETGLLHATTNDSPGDPPAPAQELRGYASLKGALAGIDWHLSAGSALTNTDGRDGLADHLLLTAGALGFLDLGPEAGVLTLLLEAGVRPAREWRESGPPAPEGLDRYGIYLFPELGYSPADNWNLSLSGLLSPVDRSGIVVAGAGWNILQGLTFRFSATAMFGGDADTFAWNRRGGLAATLAARYLFGSS